MSQKLVYEKNKNDESYIYYNNMQLAKSKNFPLF